MNQKTCNLWLERASYRCIPIIGALNGGEAVMDKGIALEAANRFQGLTTDLGRLIASRGNHVHLIRDDLVSFPVAQFAWAGPSLQIIQRSVRQLIQLVGDSPTLLPRPGCDAGELDWDAVAEALGALPDNVTVIEHK
jgi:hypothetical protein